MTAPDPGRAFHSEDTSRDAEDRQVARWREMSPAEKLTLVAELTGAVDRLALAASRVYPEIHGLDDIG